MAVGVDGGSVGSQSLLERWQEFGNFMGGGEEGNSFFSVGGVTDCKSRFDINQLIR